VSLGLHLSALSLSLSPSLLSPLSHLPTLFLCLSLISSSASDAQRAVALGHPPPIVVNCWSGPRSLSTSLMYCASTLNPKTLNPKPQTLNPKPYNLNLNPKL